MPDLTKPTPPRRQLDHSTEDGARRLAETIAIKSAKCGFPLRTRVEAVVVDHHVIYCVRSEPARP